MTPSNIEIQRLAHEDTLWDEYVRNSPDTTLYHLSGWKRIIEKTFGHTTYYLYASHKDRIRGILPLTFLKSLLFGKFFVSLPYFNYGGIVADNEQVRQRLLAEAITIAKRERAEHIELRHTDPYELGLPAKTTKVLMILDLPPTSEELWKSFKSKLRSQIRRPEKEGFSVKFGQFDQLDSFYAVFVHKMRDLGTPVYTKRFFENMLKEFPDHAEICTVYAAETPIASGFIIGFKELLQIPWAASLRAYDRFSVNMLLYWNILKFACEKKYKKFDFGRSTPDQGTYKFKKQWGPNAVQCYWHYWLASGDELPELNPYNPKYDFAIKTWQRLPLPITKFLGPKIVKFLP